MTIFDILKQIDTALAKEIAEVTGMIADGKASSYEQYQHHVGEIKGLRASKAIIHDKMKRLDDDED